MLPDSRKSLFQNGEWSALLFHYFRDKGPKLHDNLVTKLIREVGLG